MHNDECAFDSHYKYMYLFCSKCMIENQKKNGINNFLLVFDIEFLWLFPDRYEVFFEDGAYNIEIYDTVLSDTGLYKCVATNSMGSAETQARITILGKSQFEKLTGTP
jgi:hypothetical protein